MSEIIKTRDYSIFKFLDSNREKGVNRKHVEDLKRSISSRNMLDMKPIIINKDFEVIDGQHRLVAAQELGAFIYYTQPNDLKEDDIILLNVNKNWMPSDYLNYYCKKGNDNYIKLKEFMVKNRVNIKIANTLILGESFKKKDEFRAGLFIFPTDENFEEQIETCWETVEYIRKINGTDQYLTSAKFWKCLVTMINHRNFEKDKWMKNLKKNVSLITVKARHSEYLHLFMMIYNWHTSNKIHLLEEDL